MLGSPAPEPITTPTQKRREDALYAQLLAACVQVGEVVVPTMPSTVGLSEETRRVYVAMRLHCEQCLKKLGQHVAESAVSQRLVVASQQVITWLDERVRAGDISALRSLMLTLQVNLVAWIDKLTRNADRAFFLETDMRRWAGLCRGGTPATPPSEVPSPLRLAAYLVSACSYSRQCSETNRHVLSVNDTRSAFTPLAWRNGCEAASPPRLSTLTGLQRQLVSHRALLAELKGKGQPVLYDEIVLRILDLERDIAALTDDGEIALSPPASPSAVAAALKRQVFDRFFLNPSETVSTP